jgi:hypothetical protein
LTTPGLSHPACRSKMGHPWTTQPKLSPFVWLSRNNKSLSQQEKNQCKVFSSKIAYLIYANQQSSQGNQSGIRNSSIASFCCFLSNTTFHEFLLEGQMTNDLNFPTQPNFFVCCIIIIKIELNINLDSYKNYSTLQTSK